MLLANIQRKSKSFCYRKKLQLRFGTDSPISPQKLISFYCCKKKPNKSKHISLAPATEYDKWNAIVFDVSFCGLLLYISGWFPLEKCFLSTSSSKTVQLLWLFKIAINMHYNFIFHKNNGRIMFQTSSACEKKKSNTILLMKIVQPAHSVQIES